MKHCLRVVSILGAFILAGNLAIAQNRDLSAKSPPGNERRVALVLGNGAYKDVPLANPTNDARDMADALRKLGFTVDVKLDATQKQMKQAIREFGNELKRGGVGLFYFAGHGVQSKGRNYLIPVGADIASEAELEDAAVDMSLALSFMEEAKNRVNIVILDACRNNPYARSFRSASRGLAQVEAPSGTLIAFATAPGSVAADGRGRNGLYTQYLLKGLQNADTEVERIFKSVRRSVFQETGGKQIPWESSSLIGDFVFNPGQNDSAARPQQPQQPAIDPVKFELAFWDEIKNRNNADEYRAYLEQYPNGRYAKIARAKVNQLSQPAPQVSQAPARIMIGSWNGSYSYNQGGQHTVPFKLTITTINGSQFRGMISEPATFGDGTSKFLFAHIEGTVERERVSFIKTYDGTGGQTHSVNYRGVLGSGNSSFRGGWVIEKDARIVANGGFEVRQN